MTWTSERIERLEKLWHEGLTTSEIGRRLGVSKNAVVGKAHRLRLPARQSPIRRDVVRPEATRRLPAGSTCQWPMGDPLTGDFTFCGEPAESGKPYCAVHCGVAYTRGAKAEREEQREREEAA